MEVFEDIFGFITSGSIFGLPPIVVMIIPLIIGVIVGYLIHKFLKSAIIVAVIAIVAAYLGFFTLNLGSLKDLSDKYGPIAIQYGTSEASPSSGSLPSVVSHLTTSISCRLRRPPTTSMTTASKAITG
jgi:hypothetical protein